jgi:hypothetical protein
MLQEESRKFQQTIERQKLEIQALNEKIKLQKTTQK